MFFQVKGPDEIREAREQADLTQVELAAKLGVSPRTVQGWESGANTPQPRHRRAIAAWLDEEQAATA